jgi:site-specific DNA-methyltransferase (adenine-specific)
MPLGMRVSDCLRQFETGGLRRLPGGLPFVDLIEAGRTPREEKELAKHPSLKPQGLLRELVYAVLPLGRGVVLDSFMGSGSTVAAGIAMGIQCVAVERNLEYFNDAPQAIQRLSKVVVPRDQLVFALPS